MKQELSMIAKDIGQNTGQGVYVYAWEVLSRVQKNIKTSIISSLIKDNSALKKIFKEQLVLPIKSIFTKSKVYHSVAPEEGCLIPYIKKNTIVTIHDIIPLTHNERNKYFNKYFKFCIKNAIKADKIICVSEYTKEQLVSRFKVDRDKITVIHHGIDHSLFYKKNRSKNKKFTIGYFGGLGKRKKIDILLHAAKDIGKDVDVIIAGGGPQREKLENLSKNLHLKNVKFIGHVDDKDVPDFYNSLDLFIFPSEAEGFGIPIIEAMACGVPVITSNVTCMPEISGGAALCIKPGNPKLLSKSIKSVIKDKNLLKEMSKKSIERSKDFSWDKSVREHLKIYRSFS